METKSSAISEAVPVTELLDKHNYEEWAIKVRTYLKGQGLWENVIQKEYETTKDLRNYMALHVIQISCGPEAFSEIRTIESAHTAWQTLEDWYRDTGSIDKSYLQYADLYRAVIDGKLAPAREFLESLPIAINKAITCKGETAIHIAVIAGQTDIVEVLVNPPSPWSEFVDLGIEDGDGYTALMTALVYRRSRLARYLYCRTPLNDPVSAETGRNGAKLLTRAIYTRNLDLALNLIKRCPSLTHTLDDRGESPLLALAMCQAFPSRNPLVFWKQWIYDHWIHIDPSTVAAFETPSRTPNDDNGRRRNRATTIASGIRICCPSAPATYEIRLNVPNVDDGRQRNQVRTIASVVKGIEQLYHLKKIHLESMELLSCMCKEISRSSQIGELKNIDRVYDAISHAVKNGVFEFVDTILKEDRRFLGNRYRFSRNILMLAVLYRQSKIFKHIYMLDKENTLKSYGDHNDDNILHMAGMIENSTSLNQISGAALQMQRELRWFKDVERIVDPEIKERTNRNGLTPRELFTKNHESMVAKGEKWMKETARSCTVVGALIATIMFAVAFTVPGGNDQITGFPIFLKKTSFMIFIISDALSLFSSSASVLTFLGILTSRYAEEDFLVSLPRKMIIGLFTLFFSIATMTIAFSAALLIMLRQQYPWTVIPTICLACFLVSLFLWMQSRLLFEMFMSTYFPDILSRKMKEEDFRARMQGTYK